MDELLGLDCVQDDVVILYCSYRDETTVIFNILWHEVRLGKAVNLQIIKE